MNIEFYTPKEVKESLITYIRDAILQLHKQHKELLKAEICFKEKRKIVATQKVCEISLSPFKDAFVITATADNYEKAGRKAIQQLHDAIATRFKATVQPENNVLAPAEV